MICIHVRIHILSNGSLPCRSFQDSSVHDALLLATGSADNFAYIFDVSGPSVSVPDHDTTFYLTSSDEYLHAMDSVLSAIT